jgi:putative DNA primase/helicase
MTTFPSSASEPVEDGRPPHFSDEALALRFAERCAGSFKFVAAWNKWLRWDGMCWRFDDTLLAFDRARAICREAASRCNNPKLAAAIASAKTVAAVERLARADRRIAATVDQWDVDPWLLNTPEGVMDLRTGNMHPHRADNYITKITAVGPSGRCPQFLEFLERITDRDSELVAYLQRVFGYCLTGDTSEQAMFFAYGVGANGKGVLLQTIGRVFGDYCKTAATETFTESKIDRHPTELARLHNTRFVTATETEAGRHWAESRLKTLTGGDTVTAHFMHKDDFEYIPKFKLFFSGNHKPGLRSVGVAMRRRINMIHFAVTIPEDERDPHFVDKLAEEQPGILKWMIDGCLDWQKRGLAPADAVAKATADYFVAQDSFLFWIEECCECDPNARTLTTALFASWKDWAEKAGVRVGDIKTFGDAMTEKGFSWKHTKTGNSYLGLRIRQDAMPYRQDTGEGG